MARQASKNAGKTKLTPPPMLRGPESWPAHSREMWEIGRLLPYARNARTHSDAQVRQIATLIGRFGWTTPILVDEAGLIIAGHGRVLAAKLLGIAEVPVMVAIGWSEADKRAYCLADNKVAENAGWDKELLAIELAALRDMPDVDLAMIGFSLPELDRLIDDPEREGESDPDDAPEPPALPVSRRGDLWLLGEHRLLCGDSTVGADVAMVIGDAAPHLMVTDPPYGVEYDPAWRVKARQVGQIGGPTGPLENYSVGRVSNDDRVDWREAWALFPGDVAYVWSAAGGLQIDAAASLIAAGFEIRQQIIWAKQHFVIGRGHYHYQHEPCWYAVRRGRVAHWAGDRAQSTRWDIVGNNGFMKVDPATSHGTQKPVECMKRPIINNSRPGDAVYEPFCGSGTTIVACDVTQRRCIAIEIDPAYVDVAVRRWEVHSGKSAILADGELEFETIAATRRAEAKAAAVA